MGSVSASASRRPERLRVVDAEWVVHAAERAAREDREEAACEAAAPGGGEVEVPVAVTVEERPVAGPGVVKARQDVVVAVEGPHVS